MPRVVPSRELDAIIGTVVAHENGVSIDVIETDLSNLYIGNSARYRLKPSEFDAWRKGWR